MSSRNLKEISTRLLDLVLLTRVHVKTRNHKHKGLNSVIDQKLRDDNAAQRLD